MKDIEKMIVELFRQAKIRPEYSKRYYQLAVNLSTRNKVKIPPDVKKFMCKKCKDFTEKDVVVVNGLFEYKCKVCGSVIKKSS